MGKDSKGIERGKCSKPGCNCVQFLYTKEKGTRCSNCEHVPTVHSVIPEGILVTPSDEPSGFANDEEMDEEMDEESDKGSDEESNEESDEDDSDAMSHDLVGSSMDIRGILRGECTVNGCNCKQYIVQQGSKCSVCDHVPVKHVAKANKPSIVHGHFNKHKEEDDELEKDSSPIKLFSKPRKKIPSSSKKLPSDLSITDMEEDPMDLSPNVMSGSRTRIKPRKSTDHSLYFTTSPHSGARKKIQNNQLMVDSSMVPVYKPDDDYQLDTMLPTNTALASQNFSGFQRSDGYMQHSLPTVLRPNAYSQHVQTHMQQPILQPQIPQLSAPQLSAPQPSAPQPSLQKTCKLAGCNKPVFVEPNGRVHEFCGRTHANASAPTVPPHLKCSNPSCKRQKYQQNGNYLDYCGRSCRDSCRKLQQQQQQVSQVSPANACLFPGCSQPKCFDQTNNRFHDYCGQYHAQQAKQNLVRKANSQEFQRIKTHFAKMWDPRKGSCGQLHEVLVIDNPKLKNQFQKYLSSLTIKTVAWYYHGTSLKCTVWKTCTVCSDNTCGICGISQKGMLSKLKSSNIKFQRFGNGFYLAPNSSKCHDYTQGHDKYRAMLLFDVAEGNKHIVKNDQTTLKDAPQGFDSVYGQHGSALNYDEIVLYKSEALLPTHILIYIKDGIHKIAK